MTRYIFGDQVLDASSNGFAQFLAQAHKAGERPQCTCRDDGVPMYVAKTHASFCIKRMPGTGAGHAPHCESYDPPPELSGLGQVLGSAIVEQPSDGSTALKLDFALTKRPGKTPPTPGTAASDSVATDGTKLTLRGMLHFLWEEAGFHRWAPSMAGKRSWWVIRKYLLQAAEAKTVKGAGLAEILYVPETFNAERKSEIDARRASHLLRCHAGESGARRLMIVVGEVKEIGPSRYGHKIVLKHMPDFPFMLAEDIHKRMTKRFADELSLWSAFEATHLMLIATFGVGPTGVASIEEASLMNNNEGWIPFDNAHDKELLDALAAQGRRFSKGMRYNLAPTHPLASAVLTDVPEPVALYVVGPNASEQYESSLEELIASSRLPAWVWRVGEDCIPPFAPANSAVEELASAKSAGHNPVWRGSDSSYAN